MKTLKNLGVLMFVSILGCYTPLAIAETEATGSGPQNAKAHHLQQQQHLKSINSHSLNGTKTTGVSQ